jgi:KDO2-lipid IV(A) lauroyltransferase
MRTLDNATWSDWILNRILRAMIGVAMALPYATRVRFFGALAEKFIAPLTGRKKRAITHLELVWPEMDPSEHRRIANTVCNNIGRTFIENYSDADFAANLTDAEIIGDGLDALTAAKDQGRPVLFVTGHFGNHEAPRRALAQRGYTIGGLYRPMTNPYINAHYEATMLHMSGQVFPQGRRGTMGFVRMLKDGGMGTLLFDVRDNKSPRIPFMGHPASTATSVADIALKVNALVVPYFGIRQPDGISFKVAVETPIDHSTPDQMMAEITARLEARIHENPEQWFWIHRRWK